MPLPFGDAPIMVRSKRCHLAGLSEDELMNYREEPKEMGGYFITNGNEKVMRLLIVPRRNYMTALIRNSFTNRGIWQYHLCWCNIITIITISISISITIITALCPYPHAWFKMADAVSPGKRYTKYGVTMRCARDDETTQTVTLHYLSDGTVTLRVGIYKQEFL